MALNRDKSIILRMRTHLDRVRWPFGFVRRPLRRGCASGKQTRRAAEQFDVHPNQITSWKAQLEGRAADVFGPGGGNGTAQPAVDVKSLHAKIGALTLENDS